MTDLDRLQGLWQLVSLEVDGEDMPAGAAAGSTIVISRDTFTSTGMGATYEGTIEIDQTKTPGQFDLVFTAGHASGTRNPGIYRLDGDAWTICLATRGGRRPRIFATKPDSGLALETFQRAAKGRTASTAAIRPVPAAGARSNAANTAQAGVGSGTPTDWEGEWAMVSGIFSGAGMGDNMVQWCRRITHGDVTSVVAGPQVMVKARFTLDRATRPHAVDYVNLQGAHKGQSQAGIFELAGDTLKVCMAAPGKPRPRDFTSASGDGRSLTTWRVTKGRT